jgi:hypothetical protein
MPARTQHVKSEHLREFLVNPAALAKSHWVSRDLGGECADGEVLLRINRFGFSGNNVTYAMRGKGLFWKFFPAEAGHIKVPVWGFANVIGSGHPEIGQGERFYGCFPPATHVRLGVTDNNHASFTAAGPDRATIPAIYTLYHRTGMDETYRPEREEQQALLRPVFRTSFLLHDFLAEQRFFGADRIVIGSASSKTALALAFLLSHDPSSNVEVVGLTSNKNRAFLERVGYYDAVLSYGEIPSLGLVQATAYVDMSGDAAIRRDLHCHLGAALLYDSRVGTTHWNNVDDNELFEGVSPIPFSVADQMRRRLQDWGAEQLQSRVADAWRSFLVSTDAWLTLSRIEDEEGVSAMFQGMVAGNSDPSVGHVVSLRQ